MMAVITVSNRDLGALNVTSITRQDAATFIGFTSEAGELAACLGDDGSLDIIDNAYPGLRYNVERFRPLLMEALSVAHSTHKTGADT